MNEHARVSNLEYVIRDLLEAYPQIGNADIDGPYLMGRFFDKVTIPRKGRDKCWVWTGSRNEKGYGQFRICQGFVLSAHRTAFIFLGGGDPNAEYVCHHCDNPPCVNPAHLFGGTSQDNTLDAFAKGRREMAIGEDHAGSKLTSADVRKIRALARAGQKQRDIAAQYNVSQRCVWSAVNGQTWKHVCEDAS